MLEIIARSPEPFDKLRTGLSKGNEPILTLFIYGAIASLRSRCEKRAA